MPHDFYTAVELLRALGAAGPGVPVPHRGRRATPATAGVFALDRSRDRGAHELPAVGQHARRRAARRRRRRAPARRRLARARSRGGMLGDDRAREQLHRFHAMWLGYRAIPHPAELTQRVPPRDHGAARPRRVRRAAELPEPVHVRARRYSTTMLAEHYGLPAPSGGAGWVDYGDSGRAGILSHGSVLSAFSKFTDTSPTQRGIFVRTRLLCQAIPRAAGERGRRPAARRRWTRSASTTATRSTARATRARAATARWTRSASASRTTTSPGRFREHDDGLPECAIAGQGELVGDGSFSGPGELGRAAGRRGAARSRASCSSSSSSRSAARRARDEAPALAALSARVHRSRLRDFAELLAELVGSDAFALRKEPEEAVNDAQAARRTCCEALGGAWSGCRCSTAC